jgi:hypothetical protein
LDDPIIIRAFAAGLGDHLVYSTLPELYARLGRSVFIHNAPGFRNDEIRALVWESNPFVSGFSDAPANAGCVHDRLRRFSLFVRRYPSAIEAVEAIHGFRPVSKYPKIYYTPKFRRDFCRKVVVDVRSITSRFPVEVIDTYIGEMSVRLSFTAASLVKLESVHSGDNGSTALANVPTYKVESLREYVDIVYSSPLFLCTESGSQAIASAIKQGNAFPDVYALASAPTWNHGDFVYPNVKYLVTGALGRDWLT